MHDPRLETFLQVAERGSFAKAAEARFMSAVSVMKQVNALERAVGVRLVERSNHGVTLTEAGRTFAEDARRMVALSAEAAERARRAAEPGRHVLRVGTSLLRPCRLLVDLWTRIGGDNPFRLEIVPFDDEGSRLMATLTAVGRELDCFLGPYGALVYREQLGVLPLRDEPCRLAVSRGHRLAGHRRLTWDDLGGETLMLVPRGVTPQIDGVRDEAGRRGVTVVDGPPFYDVTTFNEVERKGVLLVTLQMWGDAHPGLVTLPMEWDVTLPYGLLHAAEPAPAMRAFLEVLRAAVTGGA